MEKKFLLVAVNMGYGHQRTAFPLRDWAVDGEVIMANDYVGMPERDRKIWQSIRRGYEFVSRFKRVPLIGEAVFFIMDRFQKIFPFYPKRDLSKPNTQLKQTIATIKGGWGKDLIEKLKVKSQKLKVNLPIVSTFFTPAYMAEYFGYPGEIYCVVCDADISRTWAPFEPQKSKIKYFAPTERVVERLKLYGVKSENIFLTGYPLPLENLGDEDLTVLKSDVKNRLVNLDPQKITCRLYQPLIKEYLTELPTQSNHPLTLLFSIGGAGAQKEIAEQLIKSLAEKIRKKQIKIILSVGVKKELKELFEKRTAGLGIEILWAENCFEYFAKFNLALRRTDILWTKPSELSFYAALGLPIIIAPTIGSQEEFNERWLLKSGFGLKQENPKYADQWLFDWLNKGYLAEAALQGFVEGEKLGVFKIRKICSGC
ncbi:MAG: DUF6938 domain-containing protein [Minisyncoccales bacterium]